jgi:hypothetical protein
MAFELDCVLNCLQLVGMVACLTWYVACVLACITALRAITIVVVLRAGAAVWPPAALAVLHGVHALQLHLPAVLQVRVVFGCLLCVCVCGGVLARRVFLLLLPHHELVNRRRST